MYSFNFLFIAIFVSVSLKDRKRSVDLYSLLGVQSLADVGRCGRLRWFGHLELKVWIIGCRPVDILWWRG